MIDKYNVVTRPFKGKKCPRCGAPLDDSNVPHCPNCGTEPFEEKNEGKEEEESSEKDISNSGKAETD